MQSLIGFCDALSAHSRLSFSFALKDVLNVIFPDEKSLQVFGAKDGRVGPGFEFAGIVASAGGSFEVGDRVFGIGTDFFRSRARVPTSSIAKMPPGISFEEASALPVSPHAL